jgi:hypothetical protein
MSMSTDVLNPVLVIVGHRLPTWPEVVERDHGPWDRPHLVIDTARLSVGTIVAELSSTDTSSVT